MGREMSGEESANCLREGGMQPSRASLSRLLRFACVALQLFYLDGVICFNREPRLRQHAAWREILPQYDPPIWTSTKLEHGHPFYVVWNAPTFRCGRRFGLPMELAKFGIVSNDMELFHGEAINLFYESRLGLYPKMLKNGRSFNGGIPQLANFTAHFEWVKADVDWYIPNRTYDGLAVIDWEAWRPLFKQNYSRDKKRYALRALAVVQSQHPWWMMYHIRKKTEKEFNAAARRLMDATQSLCQQLRPNAKWGFYLFPSCSNTRPGQNYCKKSTIKQNDRLHWLYRKSKALYPSIYLKKQQHPELQRLFVEGTLREAYRVSRRHAKPDVMVIPYSRFSYAKDNIFFSKEDLESTIGQAADSGAAGLVLWESTRNIQDKAHCQNLQTYVSNVLGPFVKDVLKFTQRCSESLCFGHGRCVSRQWSNYGLVNTGRYHRHRSRRSAENSGNSKSFLNVSQSRRAWRIFDRSVANNGDISKGIPVPVGEDSDPVLRHLPKPASVVSPVLGSEKVSTVDVELKRSGVVETINSIETINKPTGPVVDHGGEGLRHGEDLHQKSSDLRKNTNVETNDLGGSVIRLSNINSMIDEKSRLKTPTLAPDSSTKSTVPSKIPRKIFARLRRLGTRYALRRRKRIMRRKRIRAQFKGHVCRCYAGWTGRFCHRRVRP